jgi:hypothetical protein
VSGSGALVVNGTLVINGGTVIINGGTLIVGGPVPPPKGAAPQGCPMAKPMGNVAPPPAFNARAIFDRLDTNKDGKLSFEEFAVGVRHLQAFLAARMGEMKMPLQRGMQFAREKMGQFQGPFGRPGMGPAGPMAPMGMQPGMGPAGPMGPMGMHPGMGPMGPMGPMGMHPGMGPMGPMGMHPGMGPIGGKHEMKKPEGCKCGAKKGEAYKCGAKKPAVCKCGAKAGEPCKCGMKKSEAEKPARHAHAVEKATAGNRSIEARLTALETQQAEILRLLKSGAKPDHQNRGGKGPHHGEHNAEHEDRD